MEWESICDKYGTVGFHQEEDEIRFLAILLMLKRWKSPSVTIWNVSFAPVAPLRVVVSHCYHPSYIVASIAAFTIISTVVTHRWSSLHPWQLTSNWQKWGRELWQGWECWGWRTLELHRSKGMTTVEALLNSDHYNWSENNDNKVEKGSSFQHLFLPMFEDQ